MVQLATFLARRILSLIERRDLGEQANPEAAGRTGPLMGTAWKPLQPALYVQSRLAPQTQNCILQVIVGLAVWLVRRSL